MFIKLLSLAAAAGGCAPAATLWEGDSVTWMAKEPIVQIMDNVLVDAYPGRGPDTYDNAGLETLYTGLVKNLPKVAADGTVVIFEAGDHAVTLEFVERVADKVPDTMTLVWVTPHENLARDNRPSLEAIYEGLADEPGACIAPWHLVDTEKLSTDSVHLTPQGSLELAKLVNHYVEVVC